MMSLTYPAQRATRRALAAVVVPLALGLAACSGGSGEAVNARSVSGVVSSSGGEAAAVLPDAGAAAQGTSRAPTAAQKARDARLARVRAARFRAARVAAARRAAAARAATARRAAAARAVTVRRAAAREAARRARAHRPAPTRPAPAPTRPRGPAQAQVLRIVNAERAKAGCRALVANAVLDRVAAAHSADMATHGYFSHDSQDGRSPFDRMRAAGYAGRMMGENIAAGQTDAASVMDAWMKSPGHRANILNCGYTEIGIGYATGGPMSHYWTQDFGAR